MPASSPSRRRQRGVRVTVAVLLLGVATIAVALALPTQEPLMLSGAAVLVLVLGWAVLRMMWTEVLQSRRDHAVERAATASAYRSLFDQRAAEHAEFTAVMTERLAESQLTMRELEAELVAAQRRTAVAESDLRNQTTRLADAQERVTDLETELDRLKAEEEAARHALAVWEAGGGEPGPAEPGSVAELAEFDLKVTAAATTPATDSSRPA